MNNTTARGRHRSPGRHNPLNELRAIARESAQPAVKGVVVVAAAGGLVATFATPAGASELAVADAGGGAVQAVSPSVVGPDTGAPQTSTALASFGLTAPTTKAAARPGPAPKVIEDIDVKTQRAAAAKAKARDKADAIAKAKRQVEARAKTTAASSRNSSTRTATTRKATNAASKRTSTRGSRTTTRKPLTRSTTKKSVNRYTPRAGSGTRVSRNWATAGQCTWGALSQWYRSEGYYPGGWTGNALAWGGGARGAGYTVSSTPRSRSIVVLQPGVHGASRSAGHVAWVTSVSGNQVTVIEMNALAGAFAYNTRTMTHTGGMQYIYAP